MKRSKGLLLNSDTVENIILLFIMSTKCWFLCKYCQKAFSESVLLIKHKWKMHGEELWKDCELKLFADISETDLHSSGERYEHQPYGGTKNFPSQGLEYDRRLRSGCMSYLSRDSHRYSETAANSACAIVNGSDLNGGQTNDSIASCTSEDKEVTLGSRGTSNGGGIDVKPNNGLETDKFMVQTTTGPSGLQQRQDHHSNSPICPIDIKIFPPENAFKGHLDSAHGTEIKKHTCSYCAAEFLHLHHKELHERKHKRCRSCRVIYDNPESLKKHECATLSRVQHSSNMEDKFGESSEPRQETQMAPEIVNLPESENQCANMIVPENKSKSANMALSESDNISSNMTVPDSEKQSGSVILSESDNKPANPKVGRRSSSCRFCQRRFKGVFGLNVHLRKAHPLEIGAKIDSVDDQEERERKTTNDSEQSLNLEQQQHCTQIEAQSSETSSEGFQESHLASAEPSSTNIKPISRPQIVSKFQLPSHCQSRSFETVHDVKMIYSPGLSKDLRLQINCGILQYVCVLCECISSHRTDAYAHLFKHKI